MKFKHTKEISMNSEKPLEMMKTFDDHFGYNSDYLRELLKYSPGAYAKYEAFLPMASYRNETDINVFFISKLATMRTEDCGACIQLNIRMALEAGVPKEIIKGALNKGEGLSKELKDIYDYSVSVSNNSPMPSGLLDKIESRWGKEVIMELAISIASTKIFPTIKRALGYAKSCTLVDIEV
jgi:hypothetical protein